MDLSNLSESNALPGSISSAGQLVNYSETDDRHPEVFHRFMERIGDMKCYVAGPMTDCADHNRDAFIEGAEIVAENGYTPVTPIDIDDNHDTDDWTWADFLREDIKLITDCDVIALLPGWEESKGAQLEYRTARDLGLNLREIDLKYRGIRTHHIEDDEQEPTILTEAQRLVFGPREADYGHPYDDFSRTARIWSAILDHEVTAKQAALCMVGVKLSREVNRPKRDNLIDGAGYFAVADRIETYEEDG